MVCVCLCLGELAFSSAKRFSYIFCLFSSVKFYLIFARMERLNPFQIFNRYEINYLVNIDCIKWLDGDPS